MQYSMITREQAQTLDGFWMEGTLGNADASEFRYYIGYDADTKEITAAAAVDPRADGAQLLSIGVSPHMYGQGIGDGLMKYVLDDLREVYAPALNSAIPVIRFEGSFAEEDWPGVDAFMVHNGFALSEQSEFCCAPMQEIVNNETIRKAGDHVNTDRVKPMKEVPRSAVLAFGNEMAKQELYPGIRIDDLDQQISVFCLDGEKIEGCILMSRMDDGSLMNDWVYLAPGIEDRTLLIQMFAKCTALAREIYDPDTKVFFLPVVDTSEKLLKKLIPDISVTYQIRVYERSLMGADQPRFEEVTEADMVCHDCAYSTGCAGECAKYISKPGEVIYGGGCGLYEMA